VTREEAENVIQIFEDLYSEFTKYYGGQICISVFGLCGLRLREYLRSVTVEPITIDAEEEDMDLMEPPMDPLDYD